MRRASGTVTIHRNANMDGWAAGRAHTFFFPKSLIVKDRPSGLEYSLVAGIILQRDRGKNIDDGDDICDDAPALNFYPGFLLPSSYGDYSRWIVNFFSQVINPAHAKMKQVP